MLSLLSWISETRPPTSAVVRTHKGKTTSSSIEPIVSDTGHEPQASVYRPAARAFPRRLPRFGYPTHVEVRRGSRTGRIRWHSQRVCVSHVLDESIRSPSGSKTTRGRMKGETDIYNESSSKLIPQRGQWRSVSSAYTNLSPNIALHLGHLIPKYTNNTPTPNTVTAPIDIVSYSDCGKYLSENATRVIVRKLIATIIK